MTDDVLMQLLALSYGGLLYHGKCSNAPFSLCRVVVCCITDDVLMQLLALSYGGLLYHG